MSINYLIIDDEPIAHRVIENYCADIPELVLKGNCYNALEAIGKIDHESIDLVFLDINMPKIKGLDFLRSIPHPPLVIITTAYQEYALEGYELNVVDYLLKPFSLARFLQAYQKVQERLPANKYRTSSNAGQDSVLIKGDKKQHLLKLQEILFIEGYGNYCKIHLADKLILTHQTLNNLHLLLNDNHFIRSHKSYIVNSKAVTTIEGNRIFIGKQSIPIGQTYRSAVSIFFK
jgi:DNA-binding LytR/AlgR family response regulator